MQSLCTIFRCYNQGNIDLIEHHLQEGQSKMAHLKLTCERSKVFGQSDVTVANVYKNSIDSRFQEPQSKIPNTEHTYEVRILRL